MGTKNSSSLVAKVVPAHQRPAFLPEFFTPRLMLSGELMIYQNAEMLSSAYQGGLWNFYRLDNGGFYVAPDTTKSFGLYVPGNGFEGEISADAFGIVVTLFVLGTLVWINDEALREKFSDHYYQLREFARYHADAAQIFAAID